MTSCLMSSRYELDVLVREFELDDEDNVIGKFISEVSCIAAVD